MTQTDNPPPTLSTEQALAESERTRFGIEALALKIRELILAQPPIELLGYVWAQFAFGRLKERGDLGKQPSESDLTKQFQHTLEYMHAVWSTTPGPYPKEKLDEAKAKELLVCCSSMADAAEVERQGMISCLIFEAPSTLVVCVEYNLKRQISNVTTQMVDAPLLVRTDYKELDIEAQRQKERFIDLQ